MLRFFNMSTLSKTSQRHFGSSETISFNGTQHDGGDGVAVNFEYYGRGRSFFMQGIEATEEPLEEDIDIS